MKQQQEARKAAENARKQQEEAARQQAEVSRKAAEQAARRAVTSAWTDRVANVEEEVDRGDFLGKPAPEPSQATLPSLARALTSSALKVRLLLAEERRGLRSYGLRGAGAIRLSKDLAERRSESGR